jgi:type IV secretion system protein VirB10
LTEPSANQIATPSVLPVVGGEASNRPLWVSIVAILTFGLLLFFLLEGRREQRPLPAVSARNRDLAQGQMVEPPPLYIPPEPIRVVPPEGASQKNSDVVRSVDDAQSVSVQMPHIVAPVVAHSPVYPMIPEILSSDNLPQNSVQAPRVATVVANKSPIIVMDTSVGGNDVEGNGKEGAAIARRIRASRSRNSATIVPQGTLIDAVLETALDSTQPGQTRALVSSDVTNLRGDHVLIPRGSRLFGEYKGDVAAGQKRAFIQWQRLESPAGLTIDIDSPAVDNLGRAGIKGKVNNHFFPRLGAALLQSVVDVGTLVAARSINDANYPIFLPFPGGNAGSGVQMAGSVPKPTLKVKHGTRISVFVTRDLDFAILGGRR